MSEEVVDTADAVRAAEPQPVAEIPADPRPVYGEPDAFYEWYDEDNNGRDPGVGWDFSWGCRLTFGHDEGALRATVSMSDDDLRQGCTVRSITRGQLEDFANRLLQLLRDTESSGAANAALSEANTQILARSAPSEASPKEEKAVD